MTENGLWTEALYRETAILILGSLVVLTILIAIFKKRSGVLMAAWASIKSWLFLAPLLLVVLALPSPWPLVFLTAVGIASAKTFFQMVGMYHRSWFIWITYIFILGTGYLIFKGHTEFYNVSPMLFFACSALIPLLRNSAAQMVQYLALSLMAFIFFGWSFMHMGRLLMMPQGVYIVIYLYLLTEFSDIVSLASTRLFGRTKLFNKISPRITLEGLVCSVVLTLVLAWGMRHLLPDRSDQFWIAAGIIAAIFGRFGDLILTVIRRDLGIKDTGVFIIGRGDILARVDKLILIGPLYYYVYLHLNGINL